MSVDEFDEHYEDWKADPWGHKQIVVLLATLCSMYANAHRREGVPEFTAHDFMQKPPREEKVEEISATLADVAEFMKEVRWQP